MGLSINNMNQSVGAYQSTQVSQQEQHREKEVIKEASSENTASAVSADGDTLTISEAGKSAEAKWNGQSNADTNEESSTEDLSTYTETELMQMYLDGSITKSEYDEELLNRES